LQRALTIAQPPDENPDAGALPLKFSTKANARVEEYGYGHAISWHRIRRLHNTKGKARGARIHSWSPNT
jgi:hypothetical protein